MTIYSSKIKGLLFKNWWNTIFW